MVSRHRETRDARRHESVMALRSGENMNDIKMVIVMRKDLNMRKGKMIAQGCHAAVNAVLQGSLLENHTYKVLATKVNDDLYEWLNGLSTKICVGVNSEEELLQIADIAKEKELPIALVEDAGHTEFHGVPTLTCLAIGPAKSQLIDEVTGHLILL